MLLKWYSADTENSCLCTQTKSAGSGRDNFLMRLLHGDKILWNFNQVVSSLVKFNLSLNHSSYIPFAFHLYSVKSISLFPITVSVYCRPVNVYCGFYSDYSILITYISNVNVINPYLPFVLAFQNSSCHSVSSQTTLL